MTPIAMPRPFDAWRRTAARFRAADNVAVFLDFDGTITPIRPRPGEVSLDPRMSRVVSRLAAHPRVRVCVVSARRLADLRQRLGLPHVRCLGLHGWEGRRVPALNAETRAAVAAAKTALSRDLAGLSGIRIEDKWPVFTVHYRGASDTQICRARSVVRAIAASHPVLRVMNCKGAWEILPRAIGDKGTAVAHELRARPRALPVYLGDDTSDEPAFAALPNGVTIRVGRCALTRARFQLRDPDEVRGFLERLEAEMS